MLWLSLFIVMFAASTIWLTRPSAHCAPGAGAEIKAVAYVEELVSGRDSAEMRADIEGAVHTLTPTATSPQ